MAYQPLTPEQYKAARAKFSAEQIVAMEQKRKAQMSQATNTEQPGFIQGVVQSLTNIPTRLASSFAPVIEAVQGKSQAEIARKNVEGRDFGYFGKNVKPLGYQASQYSLGQKKFTEAYADIYKDTAGLGLEAASYAIPTGKISGAVKTSFAGKVGAGAWRGAKAGFKGGAVYSAGTSLQDENATAGDIALNTVKGAALGTMGGGALGAALPAPVATRRFIKENDSAVKIMNKVARVDPSTARKFAKDAGEDIGTYLTKRGIYEHDDELIKTLYGNFIKSKNEVDAELAKLGTTRLKNESVDEMLTQLLSRAEQVSSPGAPSSYLKTTRTLLKESQEQGLTMSQINEVKRLFEKNIKLNYAKNRLTPNTKAIEKANNLDSAVRNWQVEQASRLGFENLRELNKETQLARMLADGLWKKMAGSAQNNGLSLTDAVLVSGGNVNSLGMLMARLVFGSNAVKTAVARKLGQKATVGAPKAVIRKGISDPAKMLPEPAMRMPAPQSKSITPEEILANDARIQNQIRQNTLALPPGSPTAVPGAPIKAMAPASMEKGVPKPNYPDRLDLSKLTARQLRIVRKKVSSQKRLARKQAK